MGKMIMFIMAMLFAAVVLSKHVVYNNHGLVCFGSETEGFKIIIQAE